MTVQRFQRPVMAQLLRVDFVRRHLGGSSGGERGFDLVGRRLRYPHRGWAVHPSDGQQLECTQSLACGMSRGEALWMTVHIFWLDEHVFQQVAFMRQRLPLIQGWRQNRAMPLVGLG